MWNLLVVNKFEFQGTLSTLSQSQYRIPIYLLMIETNLRIAYYLKVMQHYYADIMFSC